jgi:hypothetical protein
MARMKRAATKQEENVVTLKAARVSHTRESEIAERCEAAAHHNRVRYFIAYIIKYI